MAWLSNLTFRQIVFLVALVSLFAPIAVVTSVNGGGYYGNLHFDVVYIIISPIWTFAFGDVYNYYYPGLWVIDPLRMIGLLPLTFFEFAFGVLVIRYCQDKCSRRRVYLGAIASMAFPLLLFVTWIPNYTAYHILGYEGPVPIQLIIGLLLVRSHKVPGSDSPWLEEEQEYTGLASKND
jgi:peptidoglycan/LPS O-acetylase OafA/YrhL